MFTTQGHGTRGKETLIQVTWEEVNWFLAYKTHILPLKNSLLDWLAMKIGLPNPTFVIVTTPSNHHPSPTIGEMCH